MGQFRRKITMWHILILVCLFQSNAAFLRIQEDSTTTVRPGYAKKALTIYNNGGTTHVATGFYRNGTEIVPEWTAEQVQSSNAATILVKFEKYTSGLPSGTPLWFRLDFWENHFPSSTSKKPEIAPMISAAKTWDRIKDINVNTRFFSFDDVWDGVRAALANTGVNAGPFNARRAPCCAGMPYAATAATYIGGNSI